MITPHDWQEGMSHRAQYVESRIAAGVPVVAVSLDAGILAVTYRRQSRKIYEIYDRLMFGGLGLQSDVEAMRVAAIDFAHQEGYQRSEQDVTIQRVVAAVSEPVKRAFADFQSPPVVAKSLFMQVGEAPELDRYYSIDYHGDFSADRGACFLCGNTAAHDVVTAGLADIDLAGMGTDEAVRQLEHLVLRAINPEGAMTRDEALNGLTLEAGLMERNLDSQRVFTLLHGDWD